MRWRAIGVSLTIVLMASLIFGACGDSTVDCDSMCGFMAGCGDASECVEKCTVNSAYSAGCEAIYEDMQACTDSAQFCSDALACFDSLGLEYRYDQNNCPE